MAIRAMGQVSVIDVTDAYSVYLTCPTYTFPGTTGAAKPGSVTTDVVAMRGGDVVQAAVGSITAPSGVTVSSSAQTDGTVRLTVSVNGTVTAPGKVTIPVTVDGGKADFTLVFSYAIAFTGAKGDTGAQGIQGIQGPKGEQGIQGPKGTNGATSYFHIKYSSVSSPTSSSQMTETPSTYIGTYVDFSSADSTDPTKYTWSQFKGSQGDKGDRGIPGTNGTNGQTSYLHIAYANSADGKTGFDVSSGANKLYIGQYTDFSSSDSTDPTKYVWTKIKGEQGIKGDTGAKGDTGPKGDNGADALTLVVSSSAGNVFKNSSGSTTLSVMLFKGATDVTSSIGSYGTVKWYKNGSYLSKTGTSITVSAADVDQKAVYTAQLEA